MYSVSVCEDYQVNTYLIAKSWMTSNLRAVFLRVCVYEIVLQKFLRIPERLLCPR